MPMKERAAVLLRLADELAAQRDDLTALIVAETGCPRPWAEAAQVDLAIESLREYAAIAVELSEWEYNEVPLRGHFAGPAAMRLSVRCWEPIGVVAAMTPYIFPLHTSVTKIAPALLAGCTVLLRPSPLAPLGVLALAGAAERAGLPPGVLSVLAEDGIEGGQLLCEHPAVDAVSFTGSTTVGRTIAAQAATTVKRVVLELGGKSAQLYLDDALSDGAHRAVAGAMAVWTNHAGQRAHRDNCLDIIGRAVEAGARVVAGGELPAGCPRGWFLAPTVLDIEDNANPAAQQEIFGPCITVQGFRDVDEAVAIANDSDYGLSGGVYTADVRLGFEIAQRIRTGTVNVNSGWAGARTPFGGVKQSGLGVERSALGFREFQYAKHIAAAPLSA
jgi:acyl-CoA reductase-like NAD-dependent aldehyde dehydrogenase